MIYLIFIRFQFSRKFNLLDSIFRLNKKKIFIMMNIFQYYGAATFSYFDRARPSFSGSFLKSFL